MCSNILSSIYANDEAEMNATLKKKQTKCQENILAIEYVRDQFELTDMLVPVLDGQYQSLSNCDFQSIQVLLQTDKTQAFSA